MKRVRSAAAHGSCPRAANWREKGRSVGGDERVSLFGDARETGQISVESKPESLAASVAQGQETGLGGAGNMSIEGNELHRALKFGLRDRRDIAPRLPDMVRSRRVARQFLPIVRPIAAEPTIAIVEELWTRVWRLALNRIGGLVSRWVLHDVNEGWRKLTLSAAGLTSPTAVDGAHRPPACTLCRYRAEIWAERFALSPWRLAAYLSRSASVGMRPFGVI